MKAFENTVLTDVDINTNMFTGHGLHMNSNGKKMTPKKIVPTTNNSLNDSEKDTLSTQQKQDHEKGKS
jgi:hypothetical protein